MEFLLNGSATSLAGVAPHITLLEFLRSRGLTGAKEGCAEGECGACAVALVYGDQESSEYRSVNSCLMLAAMAAGHEVYTVESLAENGKLAPAQAAMAAAGGSQCGYCTPGFVMSLFAEQYRRRTGPCDPLELGGNLCRCTGYRPIRDAAAELGPPPPGKFLDRLSRPPPEISEASYTCGGVRFSRPGTLEECLGILEAPEARLISGGTDLIVDANLRQVRWRHLVSTEAIRELRQFEETSSAVVIGAGLPLRDLAKRWRDAPACIETWISLFASPLIRNRATLGGNLATASPIGDGAPLLLALGATLHLARRSGSRSVPLAMFFKDYRRTALDPGEIIVSIEIPKPLPVITSFYKIAKRRMDDISTVAAAMALDFAEDGRVARARFAFGGVAAVPLRTRSAEQAAIGKPWNRETARQVREILEDELHPISDHRGSAAYRRAVAGSLIEKFWWDGRESG